MKVILLQDVKGTGKKGELKEVSEGHGRNYLLPRKLAVEATSGNVNSLKEKQRLDDVKKTQLLEDAKALATQMESLEVVLFAKSGKEGRLFGAISTKQIAEALNKQHQMKIDKKKLLIDDAIRTLGVTKVPVKLHPEVTGTLSVHVKEQG
ncbi:LSU ribosomal protein L9P [Thermoactinomyces sp. DSM 45891]|uniref:50S ribosomal protein L9 n=1 Tax=Thermoactinomyces sp. DSM 45891 TaxID=1761907 RepID=UPI0009238C69|nr:50S ribosomal protein L9 [Thermoactinomyces sp. DSM 45891]SFX30724.1 LSU ribosomal protein L9P [Thermoactinomyces sp. DSM 45891]